MDFNILINKKIFFIASGNVNEEKTNIPLSRRGVINMSFPPKSGKSNKNVDRNHSGDKKINFLLLSKKTKRNNF